MDNSNFKVREDRIDVEFKDEKFIDTLKRWKDLCKSCGGQTKRLQILISQDINKIKDDAKKDIDKK